MTTEMLYDVAYKENIDIDNFNWKNAKARIFEIDDSYSIALNRKNIYNSIEEKQVLAEELGHYYCNALYCITSKSDLIDKCELRARKWAYSVLVPFSKLKEKIAQGYNLYELADYFEVDSRYMDECIHFYTEKYGLL